MKRRNFLKTFAAACAVPVVAAKAISAPRDKRIILSNGSTIKFRKVNNREDILKGFIFLKPEDAPLSKHLTQYANQTTNN